MDDALRLRRDQKFRESWSGRSSQSGATVPVLNESWNSRIESGATVFFDFNATMSGACANPNPRSLTINGNACAMQ